VTLTLRDERPQRRKGLWIRQVEGETSIFDPETQAVHLLNDTALAIWEQCDGQTLPSEMVAAICELSALPEDVVTEDVARVLDGLDRSGLLRWVAQ
jgi:hypothetical protein